jgi:hypothetical protein
MFINYIVILYICTHIIYPCPSKLLHHIHPTSPSAGRRALEGKGGLAADVLSKQLGGNRAVLLKPRWNRDASRSLASKNTHYLYITIYFKGEIIGNAHLMYIYMYIYIHTYYIYLYIYFFWKVTVWKHPKFGRIRYMVYGFGFTAFWYQRRILWEPEPASWMI